ncbi:MAG: sulfite exporter TauE/SafE family protein [Actinomycetota bacterium]
MTLLQFAAIALIVFGASLMQALFGFGFGLISVPLMIFFVDLPTAVVTATAVSTVSCSIQWFESRAIRARQISVRLVISALFGMPFGLWLLVNLDARPMKAVLGVVVMIGVFLSVKGFDLRRLPVWFDYSMGLLAGVLSTATSTNGPPLVFLLHSRHYSPENFRAVLNRVFTVLNFLTLLTFYFAGKIDIDVVRLSALAIPVMFAGVYLGTKARRLVDADQFRSLVVALLFATGLSAILNSILG